MKSAASRQQRPVLGRPKDTSKRDDIVKAAGQLFLTGGYERTSMEAVAQKAGVSKLTIYSHFADKDQLFREVMQQRCTTLVMPESYLALADQDVEVALTKLGRNAVTLIYSDDSIRLHRIMQAEAPRHPHVVEIFYEAGPQRVRKAFGELLKEWVKRKQLVVDDIPKATEQFFSLLKGEMLMRLVLRQSSPPSKVQIRQHVQATVKFFLAAYRPSSARNS